MNSLSDCYFHTLNQKLASAALSSTASSPEERANEILRPSGAGTFLSDIISPYANLRAGRATEVSRSLGQHAPLSIAYPATGKALSALGGAAVGGGLGAALTLGSPAGTSIGALGGASLGLIANMLRRHAVISRVRNDLIQKLTTDGMNSVTPYKPDFNDSVTDYLLPVAGPARQGQAQAYRALLENTKLPSSGMNSSGLNAAQALSSVAAGTVGGPANIIVPGSGALLSAATGLANTGVNIGRNVSARNLVEGKTASGNLVPDYIEAYFNSLNKVAKSVVMHKRDKSPTGGLTQSGRNKYNRETGSHLKAPVTEKNPTGKAKSRRKSFCARMSGVKGPMKDEHGKPTRKALALRKWHCH